MTQPTRRGSPATQPPKCPSQPSGGPQLWDVCDQACNSKWSGRWVGCTAGIGVELRCTHFPDRAIEPSSIPPSLPAPLQQKPDSVNALSRAVLGSGDLAAAMERPQTPSPRICSLHLPPAPFPPKN